MKHAIGLASLVLLGACVDGNAGAGRSEPIEIRVTPVEITPAVLNGLSLKGAVELNADHPSFGGFSGLWMDKGRLIATSDVGWFLFADTDVSSGNLAPVRARMVQMKGDGGEVFTKTGGDAEGLTLVGESLWVSFERDHRIMAHAEGGQLGRTIADREWETMTSNKGLEALATLPDGRLLAFGEGKEDGAYRTYQIGLDAKVDKRLLPAQTSHLVTGADIGPDGDLYLVLRDFSPLFGISILILGYDLDAEGWPEPASRRLLARFEADSGIDNMEGIALWTDDQGLRRLTLVSDDNFNAPQRSLLVDMVLTD